MKNKIINFLKKDIMSAFLFNIAAVAICYIVSAAFGFSAMYHIDDFDIEYLIFNGEDKNLFLNYFLTVVLVWLQKIFTKINVFVFAQLIMNFFAFLAIDFVFIKKFSKKYAMLFIFITDVLFLPIAFIFIQWTHTAAIACIAGCLLMANAYHNENVKKYKILQIIFSIILLTFSVFLRKSAFESVIAIFAVYEVCEAIAFMWKQRNDKIKAKGVIKSFLKKYGKMFISLVLTVAVLFSLNIVSDHIKDSDEEYAGYKSYNSARARFNDYSVSPYEGNEEFYNSVDIYSDSDIEFFRSWFCDDEFFTEERLNAIADYSDQNLVNRKFSINLIYDLTKNKINEFTDMNPHIVLAALAILGLICLALAYLFRNRIKFLFPVIWIFAAIAYIKIFGLSYSYALALPIFAIAAISAFIFNRYHYFIVSCLSAVMVALIVYLNFTRILFRTSFTVFLPVAICLLYAIDKTSVRKNISNISSNKRRTISLLIVFVLFVSCIIPEVEIYTFYSGYSWQRAISDEINEYIEKDTEHIYVATCSSATKNYNNPFAVPEQPDNSVIAYGWLVGSDSVAAMEKKAGLKNPYRDVVDNDSAYLIVYSSIPLDMIEEYYSNHYAEPGYEIKLNLVESFGNNNIYSVASYEK